MTEELISTRSRIRASELELLLKSQGIDVVVRSIPGDNGSPHFALSVPEASLEQARQVIAEVRQEASAAPRKRPLSRQTSAKIWPWLYGLIVTNIVIWLYVEMNGGSEVRKNLVRFGASYAPAIKNGQWWRTFSAMFLHIGARHLLGNMVTLGVFGALSLPIWGPFRFFALYLFSGLAGNWLSFFLAPHPSAKAGASGAILGLLGSMAGARIHGIKMGNSRFKTWHVIAALIAFYGFMLGDGNVDHLAHLGGLLGGLVLALVLAPGLPHGDLRGPQ
jgi:membrane associated rhomboid family serine protease